MFTLWPGLKPDPGDRLGADVSIFAVEPGVTYQSWVRRTSNTAEEIRTRANEYISQASIPGEAADPHTRRQLLLVKGSVIYVRLTIEGFKRGSVILRWSMYNARNNQRVPVSDFHDVRAGDINLDTPSDRSVAQLWVPPAPGQSKVFIRVELVSREGTLLAVADSGKFAGSAAY